jgi:hypothetical protein
MRFLNAKAYELHFELGQKKPRYAILSHTWEADEVLFEDISPASDTNEKEKRGALKDIRPPSDAKWKDKKDFYKIKQT